MNKQTETLLEFLAYPLNSTKEIFDRFASLPGAVCVDGCALAENVGCDSDPIMADVFFPQAGFVFVKGSRPDAVTLIANADTQWRSSWKSETIIYKDEDGEENTYYCTINGSDIGEHQFIIDDNNTIRSLDKKCGVGVEGRAGCAVLWLLKDSGHNLLIVDGMIDNRLGAQAVRDRHPEIRKEIAKSRFLMQFSHDSKGEFDFCEMPNSREFMCFLRDETGFTLAKEARSYTESINVVNDMKDICGVNMPAGYYDMHTSDEYLIIDEWLSILGKVDKMLSKPMERYVRDELRIRPYFSPNGLYGQRIIAPPRRQSTHTPEIVEIAAEFIDSIEMREYLLEFLPDWYVPKVIVYAPKPLKNKIAALQKISDFFVDGYLESIQGWIFDVAGTMEHGRIALAELRKNYSPGTMFTLATYGFDGYNGDELRDFTSFDDILGFIQNRKEQNAYIARKYRHSDKGDNTQTICRWILDEHGEALYCDVAGDLLPVMPEKTPEGIRMSRYDMSDEYCNQTLPVPYEPGDIFQVDNRPFSEPFRAVVVYKYDDATASCAFTIADKWIGVSEVKNLPYGQDKWINYYHLTKYDDKLPENESILKTISDILLKDPTKGEILLEMVAEADENGDYEPSLPIDEVLERLKAKD